MNKRTKERDEDKNRGSEAKDKKGSTHRSCCCRHFVVLTKMSRTVPVWALVAISQSYSWWREADGRLAVASW